MKKILTFVFLSFLALVVTQAETKIGTVDMNKIFESYYKFAEAKARIGEKESAYKKERQLKIEDFQKMADEYRKLRDEIDNPALSEEVRAQKKKTATDRGTEMQQREREMSQFDQERQADIQREMVRLRNSIVGEITEAVRNYASKNAYTLVFDKTGESLFGAPMVIYAPESLDFTSAIITELNKNKPASSAAAAKPGEKPATSEGTASEEQLKTSIPDIKKP